MFRNHVFQFDFLNDGFSKCPEELQDIIIDESKRKRLVVYINPPYAEAANARTIAGTGENRINIAVTQKTYERYLSRIGIAGRELFAQFFIEKSGKKYQTSSVFDMNCRQPFSSEYTTFYSVSAVIRKHLTM